MTKPKSAAARAREDDARARDEFLTRDETALRLTRDIMMPLIEADGGATGWLEPSAGGGAFLRALPPGVPRKGLDVAPQGEGIEQADFMEWEASSSRELLGERVALFGNPPFGKNASLALRFVNKGATFSRWIGMILPRTFRKDSMKARLSEKLELIHDSDVEDGAFLFKGEVRHVPCMFAVWRVLASAPKSDENRRRGALSSKDFDFVSREEADFSFQRVGVNAGKVRESFEDRAAASHYFIRPAKGVSKEDILRRLSSLSWEKEKDSTAGNPSISKRELVARYEEAKAAEKK